MKTLEQIKKYESDCIDGRDTSRLAKFIPYNRLKDFGIEPKEEYNNEKAWNEIVKPFTRENVLEQLKNDVAFGFEKALNRRGISAGLMFEVVNMWNWILEEGLEDWDENTYKWYGLPLFKATAVKYGFDNPIGEHNGDEDGEYCDFYCKHCKIKNCDTRGTEKDWSKDEPELICETCGNKIIGPEVKGVRSGVIKNYCSFKCADKEKNK